MTTKIIGDWTSFTEEIKLPGDVMPAIATGRPQLLKLAKRPMNAEEVECLLDAIRVLMETNQELQRRLSVTWHKLRDNVAGNLKGMLSSVERIRCEMEGIDPETVSDEE